MGEFIGIVIIIGITVWLCNKDKWASNNRICPPGKHMDYSQSVTDITLHGKDYYYKKHLSGGYDIPDKK